MYEGSDVKPDDLTQRCLCQKTLLLLVPALPLCSRHEVVWYGIQHCLVQLAVLGTAPPNFF